MRFSLLLLLPAIAVTISACDRPTPVRDERPRPVRSVVVELSRTTVVLTLPGEVRPRVETRYGFRVGGKISQRLVSVGDSVKAGQPLARLDPMDLAPALASGRAQLEAANTELKLARIELERLKELRGLNYVSQAQVDRQQAQADSAEARRRTAAAQLSQATTSIGFQNLVSDTAGVVTAVEAEAGQVVAAGQTVVRIARTDEKELLINVPEADLSLARATRTWTVTIPALGSAPLSAEMRELSPLADPASRTYPMRLILRGDSAGIALGMTATAQASRESDEAFVLPMSALYSLSGEPHVWLVADDLSVGPVPVRTAGLLDDAVRITAGLKAGDRVVTAGANLLVPGQKVRLLDERPSGKDESRPDAGAGK